MKIQAIISEVEGETGFLGAGVDGGATVLMLRDVKNNLRQAAGVMMSRGDKQTALNMLGTAENARIVEAELLIPASEQVIAN